MAELYSRSLSTLDMRLDSSGDEHQQHKLRDRSNSWLTGESIQHHAENAGCREKGSDRLCNPFQTRVLPGLQTERTNDSATPAMPSLIVSESSAKQGRQDIVARTICGPLTFAGH